MPEMKQEVRYAFRLMRKSPGFTAIAVIALGLGIGANTALFSVVNSVLFRPLPYPDADRVGIIWEKSPGQGWNRINPSAPNFLDWREQSRSFQQMVLLEPGSGTVTGFGEPQQITGMRVTTNLLSFLGVKPMLGRDFTPREGWQDRVVILTHAAWLRWFGGDPKVIGRRVIADGLPYTIIGVTPPSLWLPIPSEIFVPWNDADLRGRSRMQHSYAVLARLKPNVTWDQATTELTAIERRIAAVHPQMRDWTAYVVSFHDWMVANARPALLILLAAVGLVLLIACTNLASLMLARAAARDREIAIRTALGASRWALMRQFLIETMLLGLIGGALGLLLAVWGIDLFERLMPATLHVPDSNAYLNRPKVAIDATVLGFTLLVSLATGFLFGVAPAFAAARSDANEGLKEGGRNSGSSRTSRVRGGLVIAEVALALVLLISSGLTIKSFWNIQQVQPGFSARNVLIMDTELPTDSKYRKPQEQALFFKRVLENMSNIPGVSSVGITCSLPMDEQNHRDEFKIAGRPLPPSGQLLPTDFRSINTEYFAAMGIPLKRGRVFSAYDDQDRPRVAVVDETFAERYWPPSVEGAQDPIGQRLEFGKTTVEIVGIVGAVKNSGLDRNPEPTVYVPYLQYPESRMTFVLRTPQPLTTVRAAKNALYAVDKDQPVYNIRTMQDILAGSLSTSRLTLTLLLVFAVVAIVLASIGIYGVMSYAVAQRRTEIGIRMALGAGGRSVLSLVVGQGMRLAAIGVAVGLGGAYLGSRLLASLLFAVSPTDAVIFTSTAILLSAVALFACYLPARRAAKTDPAICLRCQ